MPWQSARVEEDCVDPGNVPRAGIARRQALGGDRDPAEAVMVERPCGGIEGLALFDLDERDGRAAPRDEVDFAAGDPRADREDSPGVKPQPPRRERFGTAAALLGGAMGQARPRSSARA